MEGKTHYIGGSIGAIAGYVVLDHNGMLLEDVYPVLQFGVIYAFGIYGGMLPDADHHAESSPLKDPVGRVFNRALRIFNKPYDIMDGTLPSAMKRKSFLYKLLSILRCTHRSWQTHSELTLLFLFYVLYSLLTVNVVTPSVTIMLLMGTGLTLGIISHLLLDMMTTDGINFAIGKFIKTFFPNAPVIQTLRFVPRLSVFGTGTSYELKVRTVLGVLQYFVLAYAVITMFGYTLTM